MNMVNLHSKSINYEEPSNSNTGSSVAGSFQLKIHKAIPSEGPRKSQARSGFGSKNMLQIHGASITTAPRMLDIKEIQEVDNKNEIEAPDDAKTQLTQLRNEHSNILNNDDEIKGFEADQDDTNEMSIMMNNIDK